MGPGPLVENHSLDLIEVSLLLFQHWEAFTNITEIFILVPALLGLKGNLEMTLASRLSTAVSILTLCS